MRLLSILALIMATASLVLSLQEHSGGRTAYTIVRPGTVTIDAFSDPKMTRAISNGSGFVIDADGHVATAAHVVVGGYYRVTYADGTTAVAEVVSSDAVRDIAIVRVSRPGGSCLRLSEIDSPPGSEVMAAGNPFGLGVTVVLGVVSSYPAHPQDDIYLAATLSILALPGYSGGPVIDVSTGEVIGVVSAGYETRKGWAGIVWSVPASSLSDMFFARFGRRPSCGQS
jgi:S1-C subfamily serine protease